MPMRERNRGPATFALQAQRDAAMLVEMLVSSMNTSFSGSRSSCPSNHHFRKT